MYSISLLIIFCLIFVSHATYYHPAIIWDLNNPILQKQYWTDVVQVQTFDELIFICAHEVLSMSGHDSKAYNSKLKNNLYVKEISRDTMDFDHACDMQGAQLLKNCSDPKELMHQTVQINTIQAQPGIAIFVKGRDYMFFANSDGTEQSLSTSSSTCTMVFRIHFCVENENCSHSRSPCFLMGRKKVCEKKINPTTDYSECSPSAPWAVHNTKSTNSTMDITWKEPNTTGCNVTYYSICYRTSTEKDCKEIIAVPSSQHSVTLKNLSPSVEYRIRVGAHFCTGRANYSEEIQGNTTAIDTLFLVVENETLDPTTPIPKTQDTKKPTNSTTEYTEIVTPLPQTGGATVNVDPASIAIGFVLGIVIALGCVVGIWLICKVRSRRCKDDKTECNSNEPTVEYDHEDGTIEMTTNVGYRESVTSWPKLPQIAEDESGEGHSLYVSEA